MTAAEIERAAMSGGTLPVGLEQPEQLLFLSMRALYREYRCKSITREAARKEKFMIFREYEKAAMWHRVFRESVKRQNAAAPLLANIEKHGCGLCQELLKIMDGRSK